MNFIRGLSYKPNFAVFLLLVPTIIRWAPFFPFKCTIQIGDFLFFWPSICYLIYIMMTPLNKASNDLKKFRFIIKVAFIICIMALILVEDSSHAFSLLIQDSVFFSLLYAFAFHTPTRQQLDFLKLPIIALYIYILLQMYAAVLGLYTFDDADVVQEGMMFIRAGTKAGESNSTSVILFLFTSIITGYYIKSKLWSLVIIGVTFIVIAMGATRGALLAMTALFVVFMTIDLQKQSFVKKLFLGMGVVAIIFVVIQYNILADVLFRQQELSAAGDVTSGRTELMREVLTKSMDDSPIIGVGQGRVYPSTKELARYIAGSRKYSQYLGAPHNIWVLVLCEYGIIGIIGVLFVFYKIYKNLNMKEIISWAVIFTFLILFNTETVMIHDQSFVFICILFIMALYKNNYNKLIIQ